MPLFRTEATSTLVDFVTKLKDFLDLNGAGNPDWTIDRFDTGAGVFALSKDGADDSVEVVLYWDTATPDNIGIAQYHSGSGAGNYASGSDPWAQTGDSGNGAASTSNATIETGRFVEITNAPLRYWAFANEDGDCKVVVQISATQYVNFGFGVLEKYNDWTGGAYAYGWKFQSNASEPAMQVRSTMLLDGRSSNQSSVTMEDFVGTLRMENLPTQPASGLWAICAGNIGAANLGQDRQSTPRDRAHCIGGFRGGILAGEFGQYSGTISNGAVQAYPVTPILVDNSTNAMYPLGQMKDVLGVSLENFSAEQEVVIGADTWYLFPTRIRSDTIASTNTGYQGIMFKAN